METKYKILLGLYAAFMAYFMLVVPWSVPPEGSGFSKTQYSFVLLAPTAKSVLDVEGIVTNVVIVSIVFGGIRYGVKKFST